MRQHTRQHVLVQSHPFSSSPGTAGHVCTLHADSHNPGRFFAESNSIHNFWRSYRTVAKVLQPSPTGEPGSTTAGKRRGKKNGPKAASRGQGLILGAIWPAVDLYTTSCLTRCDPQPIPPDYKGFALTAVADLATGAVILMPASHPGGRIGGGGDGRGAM